MKLTQPDIPSKSVLMIYSVINLTNLFKWLNYWEKVSIIESVAHSTCLKPQIHSGMFPVS